jgi:hypothetical protein
MPIACDADRQGDAGDPVQGFDQSSIRQKQAVNHGLVLLVVKIDGVILQQAIV